MISEKLKSSDNFWITADREKAVRMQLDADINNLKGTINLAKRIIALKGNAGWDDFVKAVQDCRIYRRQELELSSGSNSELHILQGRCRELGAIMSLMTQTEDNTRTLVGRLESLEKERALFVKPDGRVKPQGIQS